MFEIQPNNIYTKEEVAAGLKVSEEQMGRLKSIPFTKIQRVNVISGRKLLEFIDARV